MNLWQEIAHPLQLIAEWLYNHSGRYLFRSTRIYLGLMVDALDLWVLVAAGIASFLGPLSIIAHPITLGITIVQFLLAGILWGRYGVVILIEDIFSLIFGIVPGLSALIQTLPLVTIAGIRGINIAEDNREMNWAKTKIGKTGQWIWNWAALGIGLKFFPWLWFTTDKGFWLLDKILLGIAKIIGFIF